MPGLHERHPRAVVDLLGYHGFDHAQLIGHFACVPEQLRNPESILLIGMALEFENGRGDGESRHAGGHAREPLRSTHGVRQILVEHGLQFRLVIVGIKLRGSTLLIEINDALGLWREIWKFRPPPRLRALRRHKLRQRGAPKHCQTACSRTL